MNVPSFSHENPNFSTTPVPEVVRVIDEPGAREFFQGPNRIVSYPLAQIPSLVLYQDPVSDDQFPRDLLLPLEEVIAEEAIFRMPTASITLQRAGLENAHSRNDTAMKEVWRLLGDAIGRLHEAKRVPGNIALSRILLDQTSGDVKFLPTTDFSGQSSVEEVARDLENEYVIMLMRPEQKQKLTFLTSSFYRGVEGTKNDASIKRS